MSLSSMLYQLITNATATGVGARIFPVTIPKNQRDYVNNEQVAVVYQVISNEPNEEVYTASNLDQVRVQITCYCNKYLNAETAINEIRNYIDRKQNFTLINVNVQSISLIDQRDMFDESGHLAGISQDYKFRIKRNGNAYA